MTISRESLTDDGLGWLLESSFLCRLDADDQSAFLGAARWRRFERGEVIIPAGVRGPGLELIVEGQAVVRMAARAGLGQRRLGPGHLVGERSLFVDQPTRAEVRAISPVRSLHVSPSAFHALLADSERLDTEVAGLVSLRERSGEILDLLARNPFFRLLGRGELELLLQSSAVEAAAAGQRLVRAGARDSDVFVLLKGKAAAFAPDEPDRPGQRLETGGPGWLFGHAAPLLEVRRTANVDALEPTECLVIPARAFIAVVAQNPSVLRRLYRDLAAMNLHAEAAQAAVERPALVSIYGAAGGLGATTLAYGIAAELAEHGRVVVVDLAGERTAARLGLRVADDRVGEIAVRRLEAGWRFQVLWPREREQALALLETVGASTERAWVVVAASSRDRLDVAAMGACDTAVLVRPAEDLTHAEPARHGQFRVEAVRLGRRPAEAAQHPGVTAVRVPDDRAAAESFWRGGDPEALRDERTALGRSCRRLGRVLRGRAVGLALGGGGAYGFAHIGLLRALARHGVPVDWISGSSFGAVVAGVWAAAGEEGLAELIRHRRQLQWVVAAAMVSTRALAPYIDWLVGRRLLASTEVPFLPVSMDLLSGREVVLAHGTIGDGVRSSSGLPGPFSAWRTGSWRLVDGGIINNVPASTVWEAGANFILASNVIPSTPGAMVSGARLGGVGPLGRLDDLLRSMYWLMSQAGRDRAYLSDYLFNFDAQALGAGIGLHEMHAGQRIAELGERQAEREIDAILHAWRSDVAVRVARPANG